MHEPDIIEFYDDQRADTFRWGQCKFLAFGGLLGLGQMFLFAVILLVTQNLQGVLTVGSAKPSGGQTVIVMLIAHWFLLNKLQWGFEFRALDAEVEQDHLIYLQILIRCLMIMFAFWINVWVYAAIIVLFWLFIFWGAALPSVKKPNFHGAYRPESTAMKTGATIALLIGAIQFIWLGKIVFQAA